MLDKRSRFLYGVKALQERRWKLALVQNADRSHHLGFDLTPSITAKSAAPFMVMLGLLSHLNKKHLDARSIQIYLILRQMICVIFAGHVFVIVNC